MASINYIQRSNLDTVYCRFRHKEYDFTVSTNIFIPKKFWNTRRGAVKSNYPEADAVNKKLLEMSERIMVRFNVDYTSGKKLTSVWLKDIIFNVISRPREEQEKYVFLLSFIEWWLTKHAATHKVSSNKFMSEKDVKKGWRLIDILSDYEDILGYRQKLEMVDGNFLDSFANYLADDLDYAETTTSRIIRRVRFFCARAKALNIPVNDGYKEKVYIRKNTLDYKYPYLSEEEIDVLFEAKITDPDLDIIRDNWIIGLWTGLRVSDFLTRLNIDNFNGEYIQIKTKKTGVDVTIPMHPQVHYTIAKNKGMPPKVTEQAFNYGIKKIARQIGFNQIIIGGVLRVDENGRKRVVVDRYEKWQLMTSHICRRSFCTNLIGQVPNKIIMDIAGWKKEEQMLAYNKQTSMESAAVLRDYWMNKKTNKDGKNRSVFIN